MQEEIDLGKHLRAIAAHYRLGLLIFFIIAAIIIGMQFILPTSYQATATLFAAAQQNQWRFDTRLASNPEAGKNWPKEFLELSKDAWLKEQIALQISPETGGELDGAVWVGNKQSLLHVQALSSSPEKAIDLANEWSLAFIGWVSQVYGTAATSESTLQQLEEVNKIYQKSLQDLKDFQARTGIGVAAEGQTMMEGYEWLGPLGLELAEKNRALAAQKVAQANLALLNAQFQEAKEAGKSLKDLPWQLLDVAPISARGQLTPQIAIEKSDQPRELEALLSAEIDVQSRATQALEEEVGKNQQAIMDQIEQHDQLVQERILQRENYTTFRRKVDEIQYQAKIEDVELRMLTPAAAPVTPVRAMSWPLAAILALGVGAIAGVAACYVAEYIQKRRLSA